MNVYADFILHAPTLSNSDYFIWISTLILLTDTSYKWKRYIQRKCKHHPMCLYSPPHHPNKTNETKQKQTKFILFKGCKDFR